MLVLMVFIVWCEEVTQKGKEHGNMSACSVCTCASYVSVGSQERMIMCAQQKRSQASDPL